MTTEISDAAQTATEKAAKDAGGTLVVEPHEDRTKENKTPGFSRMRTDWASPDRAMLNSIKGVIDNQMMIRFAGAFQVMNELYDLVREQDVDEVTGEFKFDRFGFAIWKTNPLTGAFIEDYTKLTHAQRENFLFRITTNLFAWEQDAADMWTDAMMAKAKWEESFATSFDAPMGRLTVDDRTQKARLGSRDDRYFAVFLSAMSRKADALVRSMTLIGQRLKDSLD